VDPAIRNIPNVRASKSEKYSPRCFWTDSTSDEYNENKIMKTVVHPMTALKYTEKGSTTIIPEKRD
jgi:hypothetical protein